MNWQDSVLFHTKSNGGHISQRSIEPLLSQGLNSYDDSIKRLKSLVKENYIQRVDEKSHSWKLTRKGDSEITPYYNSVIELIELVKPRIEKAVKSRNEIDLKGGMTGMYFTYTKMSIFRFHPYKGKEGALLYVRLPNLIGDSIDHKSNEIYISKEVLIRSSFLEKIIACHLDMVDAYYAQEA